MNFYTSPLQIKKFVKKNAKRSLVVFLILFLVLDSLFIIQNSAIAASSPWTQTDWSGGSGQTNWSDTTKFDSSSGVATGTVGQISLAATSTWYDASWAYRRKITFDNSAQAENLTNFPILVNLNSARVNYGNTQNAGQDIRFTDSNGTTLLSYEIEKWDETATSTVWVKVPQIDASSSSDYIYMYYGNPSATDAQSATSVWDSNYVMVQHLAETSGTVTNDSTSNNNDGTKLSATEPNPTTAGQIDGAQTFDGSNDDISITDSASLAVSNITIESWVNQSVFFTGASIFNRRTAANVGGVTLENGNVGFITFYAYIGGAWRNVNTSGWSINTWDYVTATYDGSNMRVYRNGSEIGTPTAISGSINNPVSPSVIIGRNIVNTTNVVNGIVDEVRVSNAARSAAWIAATYKTGVDTFNTFGSEELIYAVGSGTLTSSIFDTEFSAGAAWGTLTHNATIPANTSVSVKARTSNSSSMTGATDFSLCNAITSGADISSNNCVTDSHRYVQYQLALSNTDSVSTPIFQDISIAFVNYDSTAPVISLTALSPDPNNDNTPTLMGTSTEAIGTISAVEFQMNATSSAWSACVANDAAFDEASEPFSCTPSAALSDGSNTMYIRTTDSNNNTTPGGSESSDAFVIDTVAPSTVSNLTSSSHTTSTWSSDNTIDVAWTAATDTGGSGVAGYSFLFDTSATTTPDTIPDGTATSATSSAQSDGNSIYFHVRAVDNASNWGTASHVGPFFVDTTAPTSVSILSITVDSSSQLTVVATSTDALSGLASAPYWFDETTGGSGATDSLDWQSPANFIDNSLSPNTQYGYRTKARDIAGNESIFSATSSKYTLANVPSALSASADSQTQITASWQANSNPSGTEYYVENTTAITNSGWVTTTSWSSSGLTCGTSYSFKVKARNSDATETAFTSPISASTQSCPTTDTRARGWIFLPPTEIVDPPAEVMPPQEPAEEQIIEPAPKIEEPSAVEFLTPTEPLTKEDDAPKPQVIEMPKKMIEEPEQKEILLEIAPTEEILKKPIVKEPSKIEKPPTAESPVTAKKQETVPELPTIEVLEFVEEPKQKETPLVFQGEWGLLPSKSVSKFVLTPLPKTVMNLAQKFPELEKVFEKIGISKITDAAKLQNIKLTLPGLTESVVAPIEKIRPSEFARLQGIPIANLTFAMKQQMPSEVIFAKTGGELIDFNTTLSVTETGEFEQKISTISGKPLQLAVKPDKPVKNVKGYMVFKAKKNRPTSLRTSFNSLIKSLIFANQVFAQSLEKPVMVEEKLVLLEFEYTDPDGDGIYTAEIQTPMVGGEYELITVMDFEDPELGPEGELSVPYGVNKKEIRMIVVVDPEGYIFEKDGNKETRIPGATISLFWMNPMTKQYEIWPSQEYLQENPQVTDVSGAYSFLVPEGDYYLKVEAPGYLAYGSKPFQVREGGGVHLNIELKTKYWWLKIVDWKTILLAAVIILLLYNFYRDKIREKLLKSKIYEPR